MGAKNQGRALMPVFSFRADKEAFLRSSRRLSGSCEISCGECFSPQLAGLW